MPQNSNFDFKWLWKVPEMVGYADNNFGDCCDFEESSEFIYLFF